MELKQNLQKICKTIIKLEEAKKRGHHCKTCITIYEYYNSYIIDAIDKFLNNNNIIYNKDNSNHLWVYYNIELEK